jgi:hypothetical protein
MGSSNQEKLLTIVRSDSDVCHTCAHANGAVWPPGHLATVSVGVCGICGAEVAVCPASDWDWPDIKGRKPQREF